GETRSARRPRRASCAWWARSRTGSGGRAGPAAAERTGAAAEAPVVRPDDHGCRLDRGYCSERARLHHYRTKDKVEVDAVLETTRGRVRALHWAADSPLRRPSQGPTHRCPLADRSLISWNARALAGLDTY